MKPQVTQALDLITKSITNATSKNKLNDFLDDLLTEDELLDIAQRLEIAKYLNQGKTVEQTAKLTNSSTKTVSNINQVIKYGKGGLVL